MMVFYGLTLPLLGTALGSACVFLLINKISDNLHKMFSGFAAGVMTAASVWSLLIPSMEQSKNLGRLSFIPAASGFILGILFLLFLDKITPHLHHNGDNPHEEGPKSSLGNTAKLLFAVTLHNIPEGMAVGVIFAGFLSGEMKTSLAGALALSLGIAIQNFPEGAIVAMPMRAEGLGKTRSFLYGVLSGAVEPIAAGITILLSSVIVPILPYLLSFAAGSMIYVVVEELIPEISQGKHSHIGVLSFAGGFVLMMILDVALSF